MPARSTAATLVVPRRRRRVAAAVVAALAGLLCVGPATALAGPGVLMRLGSTGDQIPVTGAQILAGSNSGPTTYTQRERPGEKGTPITLRGMTISRLLSEAGFTASTVKYVIIVGDSGPNLTLTNPEITGSYPEGPAIVSDSGGTTRFFRPARRAGGVSELIESAPGVPLEMTVNGGSLLSVRANASPQTVRVGEKVTFSSSIAFKPPASYTYLWDFGDGNVGSGATVTHTYEISGVMRASVKVQGSGGSTADCSSICGGSQNVEVTVTGELRDPDEAPGSPQGSGTTGGLGGTGQGGTGTGTGTGDGPGASAGAGATTASEPKEPLPPLKAVRPDPDSPFSSDPKSGVGKIVVQGILLAGPGAEAEVTLPEATAGGSPKAAKGVPGVVADSSQLALSIAIALTIMLLGALQERRRVRLRVA
jgi:hypothetical protein